MSLNPNQLEQLEETVAQFLAEGKAFTGYDVTLETRRREQIMLRHRDARAEIHEIESLSDAVDFGYEADSGETVEWSKTTLNEPNSGQQVFVYHPSNVDANGYVFGNGAQVIDNQVVSVVTTPSSNDGPQGRTCGSTTPSKPPQSVAGVLNSNSNPVSGPAVCDFGSSVSNDFVSDGGGKNQDGTFSTDIRNRLLIRSEYVNQLGLSPSSPVYILADRTSNDLRLYSSMPSSGGGDSVLVDRKGYLYLSQRILKSADLQVNENFTVEFDSTDNSVRVTQAN